MPKKKFSFAKKSANLKKKEAPKEMKVQAMDQKYLEGNHLSIKDKQSETIDVKQEQYEGKESIIIENMKDCEISIPFVIKSVYIKNLTNCKVMVGAVQNASFIDYAEATNFYLASH